MTEKPKIIWHLETRKISELKEYEHNPRKIDDHNYEMLKKTLIEDGIIDKPYVNTDNVIIGGHQRKKALTELGIKEVECWVPHRELSESEIKRINIRGNKINGEFDLEILLEDFDEHDLLDGGFTEIEVDQILGGWESKLEDTDIEEEPEDKDYAIIKIQVDKHSKDEAKTILEQTLSRFHVKFV